MSYSIGYWADTKRYTKVHINRDGKPVCGSKISEALRFQWCAHGIRSGINFLECEHCKKWINKNE